MLTLLDNLWIATVGRQPDPTLYMLPNGNLELGKNLRIPATKSLKAGD